MKSGRQTSRMCPRRKAGSMWRRSKTCSRVKSAGAVSVSRMTTELVARALEQAVATRCPAEGLIHHSDRGSQYCRVHRLVLQPAAAASPLRLLVAGRLHATVHAAASRRMSVTWRPLLTTHLSFRPTKILLTRPCPRHIVAALYGYQPCCCGAQPRAVSLFNPWPLPRVPPFDDHQKHSVAAHRLLTAVRSTRGDAGSLAAALPEERTHERR